MGAVAATGLAAGLGVAFVVLGALRLSARHRASEPLGHDVPGSFAAIAESMPDLHDTDGRLGDLYLIPDRADEES